MNPISARSLALVALLGWEATAAPRLRYGVTNDLFDVHGGTVVTASSGAASPTAPENALGDDVRNSPVEPGFFTGTDGRPASFVHFLEWKTPAPVTLRSLRLHAAGDGTVFLNAREFTRFTLKAKSLGSTNFDQTIVQFVPSHPYTFVNAFHVLVLATNVVATTNQEFRAEFTDIGTRFFSGPRIVELDGFGTPLEDVPPLPTAVDSFPEPTGILLATPAGGLFTNRVQVSLSGALSGEQIRFTLDGSDPTATSPPYLLPFALNMTTVVKARLFRDGSPVGSPVSAMFSRVYAINDGIGAEWRRRYFGESFLTDPKVAADADPDGDGANNFQEFTNQTDPTDPLSGFLTRIRSVPSITWHSVPGKSYRILRRARLAGASWEIVQTSVATEFVSQYIDASVEANEAFYAVEFVR